MNSIELYRRRLVSNGKSAVDSIEESSKLSFEEDLPHSLLSDSIVVNGDEKIVLINPTRSFNEREVVSKHNELHWGDIVLYNDEQWLVTERPYFNKIHDKTRISLCNSEMKFVTKGQEIIDWDRLGNPIFGDGEDIITLFPCVIDSITNMKTATGQQINVPEGDMTLQIQNTDSELIEIGNTFEMFNDYYRISGIDRSKVYKDKGVLILVVSRVANKT